VDVLLLYVSAAILVASGSLMAMRVAGVGRVSSWTTWAPAAFGLSIIVGTVAFVHLLVSGIR
jgi:hypothetical protein